MKWKLYAAYGSNLNHGQMKIRCPNAKFIGTAKLMNHRLVFRGVADIEYERGAEVDLGLWHITDDCLQALDRYEGYPNLYSRDYFNVSTEYQETYALIYFMNSQGYRPPSTTYYQTIVNGYKDSGLPLDSLTKALKKSNQLFKKQEEEIY